MSTTFITSINAIDQLWEEETIIATNKSIDFDIFFEKNQLRLLTEKGAEFGYMLLRKGYGCQIGGCDTGSYIDGTTCSAAGANYETFDYVVFFDTSLIVLKASIVDYPGDYGYEISSKNWLKQFKGYKGEALRYGMDIDAISGATISGNSFTSDIQVVYDNLKRLLEYERNEILTGAAKK